MGKLTVPRLTPEQMRAVRRQLPVVMKFLLPLATGAVMNSPWVRFLQTAALMVAGFFVLATTVLPGLVAWLASSDVRVAGGVAVAGFVIGLMIIIWLIRIIRRRVALMVGAASKRLGL